IARRIGYLYIERNSLNMQSAILDTPEFFWEHPEVEAIYKMTIEDLDLNKRADILNNRLQILHDMFELLGNEINHRHSTILEWIIIFLIAVEVVQTLSHQFF